MSGCLCGGETGIRTLDTLRYTRFPSVRLQPLGHLSAFAQMNSYKSTTLVATALRLALVRECKRARQSAAFARALLREISLHRLSESTTNLQNETKPRNLSLLFDADDTLWENNVYFERAIASFISFLDHRTHTREEVREQLNACEHATIKQHGYGLQSFRRSLLRCFEQLVDTPITPDVHARIVAFADTVADAQIELLPHVEETLNELAQRHRLLLVTKGVYDEQMAKLERSGLRQLFSVVEVVAEKNAAAYRRILAEHGCDPAGTWMIGNSPRSDINPALAAGLNAVFIPHASTWVLEDEVLEIPERASRLLQLDSFVELLEHF